MEYPKNITTAAEAILAKLPRCPRTVLILEHGMEALTDMVGQPLVMPFAEIPGAEEIPGELVFGLINGRLTCALCAHGQDAVVPVQLFAAMGVRTILMVGAAQAVNPRYRDGDLVLLCGHVDKDGSRSAILYQTELMQDIKELAAFAATPLWEGVYGASGTDADVAGDSLMPGALAALEQEKEVIALCGVASDESALDKIHVKLRRLLREMMMYL